MTALPLADRTRRGIAQLRQLGGDLAEAFSAVWRRSLQMRVVISTLALSTTVVVVLGLILQTQIALRRAAGQGGRHAGPRRGRPGAAGARPVRRRPGPRGRPGRAQQRAGPADQQHRGRRGPGLTGGRRVPRGAHHGPQRRRQPGGRRGPVEDVPPDLREKVAEGTLSRKYVTLDRAGRRGAHAAGRAAGPDRERRPGVLPAVPADRRAAHAGPGAEHADRRRADPAAAAGRHRQPGHPAGGAPGPAGRRDRGAVRRRAPRRADAGGRRGRVGPARRVVQRDGPEHPGADPPAGGVRRAAAAVHLRRQPRAAHPADHRADGRRRAARLPRAELLPALRRSSELLVAELDRFEALLADLLEISRLDAGVADLGAERVDVRGVVARAVEAVRGIADETGTELRAGLPEPAVYAEVDPRRVERIVRNLVANAIDHGEGRPVRIELALRRATRSRCWSATTASACARGRPSWCSTGSGGPRSRGPGAAAAAAWACRSRSRTPACTAAGCRPGASSGRGRRSG